MDAYEPEYATVFESWSMQFTAALLRGLIGEQARGSMRVRSIEMDDAHGVVRVVVEHYGNGDHPHTRLGYELAFEELRKVPPDEDPVRAATLYLDDLASPGYPSDTLADDEIVWTVRPGWVEQNT
ncbi:hypothetical protein [Rhodococcus sp. NPDC058521]|uniref:hypothetical protein n=1 Tax=Rhodococcus sp. NPDC058521 TaxID=3346536 RepID=UPI003654E759